MMAKPITALELHYPMIHFLIIHISWKIMGRESYAYDIYIERVIFLKRSCLEIAVRNSKGFIEFLK